MSMTNNAANRLNYTLPFEQAAALFAIPKMDPHQPDFDLWQDQINRLWAIAGQEQRFKWTTVDDVKFDEVDGELVGASFTAEPEGAISDSEAEAWVYANKSPVTGAAGEFERMVAAYKAGKSAGLKIAGDLTRKTNDPLTYGGKVLTWGDVIEGLLKKARVDRAGVDLTGGHTEVRRAKPVVVPEPWEPRS
jgi:hypothetical protein